VCVKSDFHSDYEICSLRLCINPNCTTLREQDSEHYNHVVQVGYLRKTDSTITLNTYFVFEEMSVVNDCVHIGTCANLIFQHFFVDAYRQRIHPYRIMIFSSGFRTAFLSSHMTLCSCSCPAFEFPSCTR